jgi:hypothetical protein
LWRERQEAKALYLEVATDPRAGVSEDGDSADAAFGGEIVGRRGVKRVREPRRPPRIAI